jgi:UDP-N-acetyl-D-mannosaminuronic acid dehydrogenase
MGYVGIPVAAIIADSGINTIGIDIDEKKVESLNLGNYPIEGSEPGIQELIKKVVDNGILQSTTDYNLAKDADVWMVCVQTPFDVEKMQPNFTALCSSIKAIGSVMKKGCVVIVESTIPPGTMSGEVREWLEGESGMMAGLDFGLGHCPERVMPGKLIENLTSYGRALGGIDEDTHDVMEEIYARVTSGKLTRVTLETAEVVKTFENTYRDAEIAIANDFAKYCDAVGVDFFEVRELVNSVESRNLHLPGGGVGGHCIPKDTWLLAHGSRGKYEPEFLIKSREVNDSMPKYVLKLTNDGLNRLGLEINSCRIGILGLSYLEESDDIRNSPTISLLKEMEQINCKIEVHDHYVSSCDGVTLNRSLNDVIANSDALIVMVSHAQYRELDLLEISRNMRTPFIVDARNVFDTNDLKISGIDYFSIGRGNSFD